MSLTYGFYNSINEDRKYNASQLSKLFDGVLNDGIFMSIGDKFMVTANTGMNISIGTGRAWFNHTWTYNDSILVLPVSVSEILLNRIDVVVLEVNNTEAVRANSIKIIKGAGATVPVAPTLVNTSEIHQYPLAHIYVGVGVTEIIAANITNKVGLSATPFATGVMQTMSIDALIAQWQGEWDNWSAVQQADYMAWFNNINSLLGTEPATNLQLQVTAIKDPPLDKATPVDVDYMVVADSTASNVFKKLTWANIKTTLKAYFDTLYNNYSHPTSDGNLHVPATGTTNNGKVLKAGATAGSLVWGTVDGYVHPTVDKATPVDADNVAISDSAASGALKKLTWANIKATLLAYFNTKYLALSGGTLTGQLVTNTPGSASSITGLTSGFAIDIPLVSGLTAGKYTAGIRLRSTVTGGYTQHTVIGQYRESTASFGSTFIAVGGSDASPTVAYYFDSNGNFTAPGNVAAYSDERLKDNIVTIPNALEKVLALRGVEFDRNGMHSIGVIAQEVQKVVPEVVLENSDEMKTLAVAYGNLVGLLIEAIKDQQVQIDELKAKVN